MSDRNETLERQVMELQKKIEEMEPKVVYCDKVLQSRDAIPVTMIARDYGLSAVAFNRLLYQLGIQYKKGDVWYLYARYQGYGYMKGKTHNYPGAEGREHAKEHSYWTHKGRMFLYDFLGAEDVLPLN